MKRSAITLGVLMMGWPLLAAAQTVPIDTMEVSVGQGLQLVLGGEVSHADGVRLILRAGASRDAAYTSPLKQIVESWAPGGIANDRRHRPYEMHTAAALYSLWLIGEGEDYFRANLYNWREDYMLAHQSAIILALNPTPQFLAELESICEESENPDGGNFLWSDLSRAQGVANQIEVYEALPDDRARARMVVEELASGWILPSNRTEYRMNPTGSGWTEIRFSDPRVVVRWQLFRSLSSEQHDLVAGAIRNLPTVVFDHALGRDRELTPEEVESRKAWLTYMAALPTE